MAEKLSSTPSSTAPVIDITTRERMAAPAADVRVGHTEPPADVDPLSNWTEKEIFTECVWVSDETTAKKIFLLCLANEFDDNAQSGTISYSQIAARSSLHESTTKKLARQVTGNDPNGEHRVWLIIKVGGGFYVENKGYTNLYMGMAPADLVEHVRQLAGSPQTTPSSTGVAQEYPDPDRGSPGIPRPAKSGVASDSPGSPQTTHTLSLKEKDENALATPSPPSSKIELPRAPLSSKKGGGARKKAAAPTHPHFNGCGFFISDEYVLEQKHVEELGNLFPQIDLKISLPYLAGVFLRGKGRLNFPDCPHLWFRKKLKEDADKVRGEKNRVGKGKSKRGELNEL